MARSICEVEGRVPDLLGEILNDRCPGFLRTEEALPVPPEPCALRESATWRGHYRAVDSRRQIARSTARVPSIGCAADQIRFRRTWGRKLEVSAWCIWE